MQPPENKSAVIDRQGEILHVHATRSIAIHERPSGSRERARGLRRLGGIISEDAVSNRVCILLLSRKPVVVSSSRLFAPGRSGVTPRASARALASYLVLEIAGFPLCAPHAADTLSKLTSDISVFHRGPPLRRYLDYSQPVAGFYVCTLGCAEARAGNSPSVRSPRKVYR